MKLAPAFKPIALPKGPVRHMTLSSSQMALVLALERVCRLAGLWIVCDRCARERGTYSHLVTQNSPQDELWTMDCPCTNRRFRRVDLMHSMVPSGDLLLIAPALLSGTDLAVRCPNKLTQCLTTPLTVQAEVNGTTARCLCWQINLQAGVYRFRKQEKVPA
jgi:hypothetical protein